MARLALRSFFPLSGDSLESGIVLQGPETSYVVKAKFVGFLADLKEHKMITEWKGTSGNVCCLRCSNVWKPALGAQADGTIGLDRSDPRMFRKRTSAELDTVLTALVVESGRMRKTAFAKLETDLGINYCPRGILFDRTLVDIYNAVDHTIVDWMHTTCSDGVGNT